MKIPIPEVLDLETSPETERAIGFISNVNELQNGYTTEKLVFTHENRSKFDFSQFADQI